MNKAEDKIKEIKHQIDIDNIALGVIEIQKEREMEKFAYTTTFAEIHFLNKRISRLDEVAEHIRLKRDELEAKKEEMVLDMRKERSGLSW